MTAGLDVPAGRLLHLLAWEFTPNPGGRDEIVWVVAVANDVTDGVVQMTGHVCAGPEPDCGGGYCFQADVVVAAIHANLAGTR